MPAYSPQRWAHQQRAKWVTIHLRVTRDEHAALEDLIFQSGQGSFQSYLRTMVVEKIRSAGALPPPHEPAHAA